MLKFNKQIIRLQELWWQQRWWQQQWWQQQWWQQQLPQPGPESTIGILIVIWKPYLEEAVDLSPDAILTGALERVLEALVGGNLGACLLQVSHVSLGDVAGTP